MARASRFVNCSLADHVGEDFAPDKPIPAMTLAIVTSMVCLVVVILLTLITTTEQAYNVIVKMKIRSARYAHRDQPTPAHSLWDRLSEFQQDIEENAAILDEMLRELRVP